MYTNQFVFILWFIIEHVIFFVTGTKFLLTNLKNFFLEPKD